MKTLATAKATIVLYKINTVLGLIRLVLIKHRNLITDDVVYSIMTVRGQEKMYFEWREQNPKIPWTDQ